MALIKLTTQVQISSYGSSVLDETITTTTEDIYINPDKIESLCNHGLTTITLSSGQTYKVVETPDEIISAIGE